MAIRRSYSDTVHAGTEFTLNSRPADDSSDMKVVGEYSNKCQPTINFTAAPYARTKNVAIVHIRI